MPSTAIPNTWTFAFNPASLPLYPKANSPAPFCWGFWIYGDGEYSPSALRPYWHSYPLPSAINPYTPPYSSHSFPPNYATSYNVIGYVMSRKTDPPPPAAPKVAIKASTPKIVTTSLAANPFARPNLIAPNRKILLEHSHGYYRYAGEESVFAISYLPDTLCSKDTSNRVLLFYNSSKPDFSHNASPSPLFTYLNTQTPNYFPGSVSAVPAGIPITLFDSQNGSSFGLEFGSVYAWNVTNTYLNNARNGVGGMGSRNKGELRIFPAVTTLNAPSTLDYGYALSVLTSVCSIPAYADSATIKRLNGIFSRVLPGLSNPIRIGNSWVLDADTILLKSGEPTDPNGITITKACTNNQVFLNLQFCNLPDATAHANQSNVIFEVIDPNFEWCRIVNNKIEYPEGTFLTVHKNSMMELGLKRRPTLYNCSNHSLEIYRDLQPGACANIEVILQLKPHASLGMPLLDYLATHHILQATVRLLPSPDILTVQNELLKIFDGSKEEERYELSLSECHDTVCESCTPKKGWYIFGSLFLVTMLYLYYKKRIARKRKDLSARGKNASGKDQS